ncbi:dipeptidyl aminopeptidase/acylaminoacyl peptidase [Psychrobacillus insolitus]|uniref:Dipeptidyl aminopeptidase/acylaminoacyl peptidase n=2 Tax=Psychrobacillus insolitus TaxID=1461 RepID=A0A2W7MLV6_9BACI|nr:dipeptidyl aminopeptidase/acylaminoacyl peptidase [Psychrobacillus insolitus]
MSKYNTMDIWKAGIYMTKRKLIATDLFKLHSITNPVLAPSGKEAVFIRTIMHELDNKYYTYLHHVNLETKAVSQWTYTKEIISCPQWSNDGKSIAFLSNREEKNQLFLMSSDGGEAKKLTDLENGVSSFVWSPCSEKIWISALLKEGKTWSEKADKKEIKLPEVYVVDQMKYHMDGTGLLPKDTYKQIGWIDLNTEEIVPFKVGNYHYNLETISHDGKKLVIGVNREENQDFSFREPLLLVDVETKVETVIVDEEGYFGGVAFSKDDQYLAFVGSPCTFQNATHSEVYIYELGTGIRQSLTEGIDAPVGDYVAADFQQGGRAPSVVWTESNHLYFQLSTMGDVRLYFASLEGELYPATGEYEHVYGYDVDASGIFALVTISTSIFPGELFCQNLATGERTALTNFNETFIKDVELVEPEVVVYKGAKDWDVYGWLMKPVGYEEGQKYPLVVEIHGGPHTMYANTFSHEFQLLAAEGYGVLYVNPRGSHGYSQAFVDAVRGDYGGGDYEDIMAGLEYVVKENDWIDETRLGVTGGSYGGFMTNWIVGHTNRFKAAVTQRSISNWVSFYGVSDVGYYLTPWQIGADMTDIDKLWNASPLKYAANIDTPLLILHSENDYRCPIEQGQQLYITLKAMGKETSFVRFPEASHNLSRTGLPNLRIERLKQITGWFKKYI